MSYELEVNVKEFYLKSECYRLLICEVLLFNLWEQNYELKKKCCEEFRLLALNPQRVCQNILDVPGIICFHSYISSWVNI